MTIETSRFDAAAHLGDADIQSEMLSEALASNDRRLFAHVLGTIARARGMTELAKETGLSRSALYAALREDGNPTLETLQKMLSAFNIRLAAQPMADVASARLT